MAVITKVPIVFKQWQSLAEKANVFSSTELIKDLDQIDAFLTESRTLEGGIYRGMSEACWRLYSSAQREFIKREFIDLYYFSDVYIKQMLKSFRASRYALFLARVFKQHGCDINDDFAVLSYLQHYGAPTPLLDFSKKRNIALYFACQNCNMTVSESGRDIDGYVSVYQIEQNKFDMFIPMPKEFQYNMTSCGTGTYILDDNRTFTNDNILAQEGCFVVFNKTVFEDLTLDDLSVERVFGNPLPGFPHSQSQIICHKITCYNIKKNLIPYIKRKLAEDDDITDETMFPMPQRIVSGFYQDFLAHPEVRLRH